MLIRLGFAVGLVQINPRYSTLKELQDNCNPINLISTDCYRKSYSNHDILRVQNDIVIVDK
jgi:hypothetical protein